MAINFPNSPSVNDTFTSGGTTFTWNGSSWVSAISTNILDDTTPQLGGDLDGATKNIHNVGVITATNVSASGSITAANFYGDGTNLTGIDASSIKSGGTVKVQAVSTGADVTGNLGVSGNVSAVNGTFAGNVSIAGTLTYEDVTNIDSVGLVTARSGVRVTGGGLDVAGVSTFNDKVAIGTDVVSNSGKLHFATADGYISRASISVGNPITDYGLYVVDSTSNANSNLHQNYVRQTTSGNYAVSVGAANAFRVSNNSGSSSHTANPGGMQDNEVAFVVNPDTSTELRYNYDKKLETTGYGVTVAGIVSATSFYGDGTNLTGIDASALTSGATVKVQAVSTGATVTGNLDVSGVIRQELHTPGMPMGLNDDIGEHWYDINPNIGLEVLEKINELVYCGDGIVLAAAGSYYGNVFRSTDYGKTWTNAEIGIGETQANVQSLAYCGNGIVLAGSSYQSAGAGDIYRSTDYGLTWTKIYDSATLQYINALEYCGNGIVLAGSGTISTADEGDVYRSTDFGQTWTKVEMGSNLEAIHALCYIGNGIVLAGSGNNADDGDVYRSTDFGQNWTKVEMGAVLERILSFAYCGNGIVLAGSGTGSGDGDVHRSTDFGQNWTQIEMGSSFEEVLSLAYCDNGIVLAGTGSGTGDAFVYKSIDYGQTWTQVVVDQYGSSQTIESLCYLGNGTVLAGGGNTMLRGDVWRSDVGFSQGSTAQSIHHQNTSGNIGIGSVEPIVKLDVAGFIKQELHTPGMLVGLNDDIGKVWNKVEMGAGIEKIHALVYCGKGIVLAGSGTGGNDGDIYRSTDFGRTFTQIEMSPGLDQIHSFAYCGNGIVLAGGGGASGYGDVYRSTDDGQSWTKIEMGADLESILSLVYCGDGIALAGSGSSTGDGDIYRSTDYGQTWTKTYDSTTLETIYSLCYLGNGIVLAGTGSDTQDGDILRSTDYGQNWDLINLGTSNYLEAIHTIVYCGSGVVLAGAGFDTDGIRGNGVVFRSKNYGKSWVREIPQVDGSSQTDLESIHSLVYCDNGIVLAGTGSDTGDGDILKSTDLGETWTKIEMGSGLESILSLVYCGDGLVLAGTGSGTDDGDVYRSDVGFTQSSAISTFAPKIIAFDPPALSTNVVVEKTITITFDQNISFSGSGTIELRSGSSTGTVIESFAITSGSPASGLSISGTQLIINPTSDFSVNTVVYVILPSSGIANATGDSYIGSSNYNFQTENVAYTISGGDSEFIVNDTGSPTNYYKYHIFSSSGPLTLSDPSAVGDSLYMLAVAGGGGGGVGGGGAGGLKTLTGPQMVLSAGSYTVTIGAGGNGSPSGSGGTPGGDTGIGPTSSPTSYVVAANGGGRGATNPSSDSPSPTVYFAEPGGSGGGVHGSNTSSYTNYGTGIPGQGNRGGANYNPQPSWGSPTGAGGGGAGGNGSDCINGPYPSPGTSAAITMGNGGSGISVPQFSYPNIAPSPAVPANLAAANNQYAGGGGGGSPARNWDNGSRTGGTASAGGGYGRWPTDFTGGPPGPGPSDGINMTGGGGGGGPTGAPGTGSGNGGDGVVMIRYAVNWPA